MFAAGTVTCIAHSTCVVVIAGTDVVIAGNVVIEAGGGVEQPCGWVEHPEKVIVLVNDFS